MKMNYFKKFLALSLALMMALSLVACTNKDQPLDPDRNAPEPQVGVASPGGYAPGTGDPDYGLGEEAEPETTEAAVSNTTKAAVKGATIGGKMKLMTAEVAAGCTSAAIGVVEAVQASLNEAS